MCSIAGFCNLSAHWHENISRMNEVQSHRGPDGDGVWAEEDKSVVLGHRRLSIIDLSATGAQPMISRSERYVICFNGEIYNYKAVRALLALGDGNVSAFHSDTRVLLEAFDQWGIVRTLQFVKGMFAFALYDRVERKLYLVRDRMGEKPLYYGRIGNGFIFASTINAIAKHDLCKKEIHLPALELYFRGGYIPCPYTVYKGINKLTPGTVLQFDVRNGEIATEKYWDIEKKAKERFLFDGSYVQAKEELHRRLVQAVSEQLTADVPVGVMLSSGVDSSTIAAIMASCSKERIKTFSIGFQNDSIKNEAPYAKKIAMHIGTDHTELYLEDKDVIEVIPKMAAIYGEPYADASQIPTYLVSRLAKTRVKVALTGDAGDELFCGYTSYPKFARLWDFIKWMPKLVRFGSGKIYEVISTQLGNARQELYGHLLQANSIEDIYRQYFIKGNYADTFVKINVTGEYQGVLDTYSSRNLKNGMESLMLLDQMLYMPDDILTKVDRAAMAVSLETRVPFLDRDVVSFSWTLPLEFKHKNGVSKRILRDILHEYVPAELVDLPKRGFGFPLAKWIREGELRQWAEMLLSDENLKKYEYLNKDTIRRIWRQFINKGYWNSKIWYVLMYLEWEKQEHAAVG